MRAIEAGQMWRLRTIDGPMTVRVVSVVPRDYGRGYTSPRGRRIVLEHVDGAQLADTAGWRERDLTDSPNAELIEGPQL